MSKSKPKVSVGLPVYNGAEWIRQTIESILSQSFSDFELIISDNQSTDDTVDICREFAQQDERVTVHVNDVNIGAPMNFNKVFELSSAEYFKWASSNDLIAPDYLERCVAILDAEPDVVVAASKTQIIDEQNRVVEECKEDMHLYDDDPFARFVLFLKRVRLNNLEQALMRKDVLRRTAMQRAYPGSDVLLVAEMVARGKVHQIPEYLLSRRIARTATTYLMSKEEKCDFYLPNTKHIPHLQLRKTAALVGIANRIDVPFATRLRFYRQCFRFLVWSRAVIAREAAEHLKRLARRPAAG